MRLDAQTRIEEGAWSAVLAARPDQLDELVRLAEYVVGSPARRETPVECLAENLVEALRHIAGTPSASECAAESSDAALVALAEAAIAAMRAAEARCDEEGDVPPGTFDRALALLELVTAAQARTPAGLAAKARVLLAHMPEVDLGCDGICAAELGISIAKDVVRLDRPAPAAAPSKTASDPILAAIEASRLVGDADTALLALAPAVLPLLDRCDAEWAVVAVAYAAAQAEAEALGIEVGSPPGASLASWRAYSAVYEPAVALGDLVEAMVAPHMGVPARTLDGLLLKRRIGRTLEHYERAGADDLDALLAARAAPSAPAPAAAPARPAPDPIIAAIEASRRANDAFGRSAAEDAPDTDRLCRANAEAWRALLATAPTTIAGARALAAHAADWLEANPGVEQDEALTLLRRLASAGRGPDARPEARPERGRTSAAADDYRAAHRAFLATPIRDGESLDAAVARKDAALAALLATRPATSEERLAYAAGAVFGFADMGRDGAGIPSDLLRAASRTLGEALPEWAALAPPFHDDPASAAPALQAAK